MKNINNSLYGDEEVFAVPYQNTLDIQNGFTHAKHDPKIWSKYDNLGRYLPRDIVEGRQEFQQIVPYIIIRSVDGNFLTAKQKNTDKTKNIMSLGFGGHIIPSDGLQSVIFKAAVRELLEQIDIVNLSPMKFVGYVREHNSDIKDHLGVVFIIDMLEQKEVSIKDTDNLEMLWHSIDDMVEHYSKYETWSKHIINHLVTTPL